MDQHHLRPKAYYNAGYWSTLDAVELRDCWHRTVGTYTRLRLTYELDIFPRCRVLQRAPKLYGTRGTWLDSGRRLCWTTCSGTGTRELPWWIRRVEW